MPRPAFEGGLAPMHRKLFVLSGLATLLFALGLAWSMDARDPDSLRVFASYWGSGWAASHGLAPYAVQPQTWIYEVRGLTVVDLNLNPPLLLPLFQGLAHFDLVVAARAWLFASCLLYLATVAVLLRWIGPSVQVRQIVWLFATPAFFDTIVLGQIYIGLFALSVLAWIALSGRRFVVAGLAIGLLVAIKPTFVLWPVLLFLAGHRRPALVAALTGLVLSAVPAALYGPGIYADWLVALSLDHHALIPIDASIQGYLARIGMAPLAPAVAATLVLGVSVWIWRRRFDAPDVTRIALTLTILASPLSWMHYVLLLVPALIDRPWTRTLTAAAVLLTIPTAVPLQAIGSARPVMALLSAVYLAAVLLIFRAFVTKLEIAPMAKDSDARSMILVASTS